MTGRTRTTLTSQAANKTAIKEWAKLAGPGQTKAFTFEAGRIIGHGIVRGSSQMQSMTKVVVVLSKVASQNRIYFVLTSYPSVDTQNRPVMDTSKPAR